MRLTDCWRIRVSPLTVTSIERRLSQASEAENELWIDPSVKSAFIGNTPEEVLDCRKKGYDVEKDIRFWAGAGYDFIRMTPRYEFPKCWLNHPEATLRTLDEYEKYPWPAEAQFDYSDMEKAASLLPPGMKVMASPQWGIF